MTRHLRSVAAKTEAIGVVGLDDAAIAKSGTVLVASRADVADRWRALDHATAAASRLALPAPTRDHQANSPEIQPRLSRRGDVVHVIHGTRRT